eukprot:CAMPEP_0202701102 /NCGR_PEP_ID=MMETSP1385-20130828/14206_1 /ASSEMBLY_ACC=CAM_ASM_000861 /TAXON_ID=933848 /ORGANISM="Elphidium margaritaceum" /LENGTH=205 /DNA_ID=CAMNT_0049358435 /DNA_START=23 /DNA_END=640 /DNA_ORIENTATION=-
MTSASAVLDEDWKNLLNASQTINLGNERFQINRNLQGIEAEAHRISSKPTKHVTNHQLKNFALQAGVNIQHQKQYIAQLANMSDDMDVEHQLQQTTERGKQRKPQTPLLEQRDGPVYKFEHGINTIDLENFLKDHHEYVVSSIINQSQQMTAIKFRKKYQISIEEEWESNTKMEILKFLKSQNGDSDEYSDAQNLSMLDYPKFVN